MHKIPKCLNLNKMWVDNLLLKPEIKRESERILNRLKMKVQHSDELRRPIFALRHYLNCGLCNGISSSFSPSIVFPSISFSAVASPVWLRLLITVEGMSNIEGLGEIKRSSHAKFIAMKLLNIVT